MTSASPNTTDIHYAWQQRPSVFCAVGTEFLKYHSAKMLALTCFRILFLQLRPQSFRISHPNPFPRLHLPFTIRTTGHCLGTLKAVNVVVPPHRQYTTLPFSVASSFRVQKINRKSNKSLLHQQTSVL